MIAITDPTNPVYTGNYDPPQGGAYDVDVTGDYAFLACTNHGMRVVSMNSARTVFNLVAEATPQEKIEEVRIRGNYVYCAAGRDGLLIYDISDVTEGTPSDFGDEDEVGDVDPGAGYALELSGDYVYLANGEAGVYVIDISDPANPSTEYTLNTAGSAKFSKVVGDYLFIADDTGGLSIWDITPLPDSTPTLVETYNANSPSYNYLDVSGFNAFVSDGDDGLRILDVRDYDSPMQKGHPRLQYDMIGIPSTVANGDHVTLFGDDMGNTPGSPYWRLSRWDDDAYKYIRLNETDSRDTLTNDDPADFAPGLGYWLIQNTVDNCVLDITVEQNTGIVNQATRYSVPLSPGRPIGSKTMLANPYHYPYDLSTTYFSIDGGAAISYATAVAGGYINAFVYTYNSSTQTYNDPIPYNTSLPPWKGFWVIQSDNTVSIDFLFTPAGYGALMGNNSGDDELDERDWFLDLSVVSTDGQYQDKANRIGISANSDDLYDPFDAFEFTPMSSHFVQLYFPHNDWDDFPNNYTWDQRSLEFNSEKSWDVCIRCWNTPETEYVVTWPNIDEISDEYSFILVDPESGEKIVNLRETDQVTFTTGEFAGDYEYAEYSIVVNYIEEEVDRSNSAIPEEFGLVSLYPNPFNSSISATIGLPETSVLEVRVYNILGKEVAVLANRSYSAGYHTMVFNTDDLSSGVYFLKASIPGESSKVRKIVHLK